MKKLYVLLLPVVLLLAGCDKSSERATPAKEHTVTLRYVGQNLQQNAPNQQFYLPCYIQATVAPTTAGRNQPLNRQYNLPLSTVTDFDETTSLGKILETETVEFNLGINYSYADARARAVPGMKLRLEIMVDGVERKRLILDQPTLPATQASALVEYRLAPGEW